MQDGNQGCTDHDRPRYYHSRKGFCRICSEEAILTFDHVPPKGCVGASTRNMHTITGYLGCNEISARPRVLQNGMKFRSLCPRCNNALLGREYDPSLKEFADQVNTCLRLSDMSISLPEVVRAEIKPQRVARAIVGHLLAADLALGVDHPPNQAPFPSAMQKYFLDPALPSPAGLEIYYWPYPSEVQAIINWCSIMTLSSTKGIMSCFLKFYPFAFWAVWDKPSDADVGGRHLLPLTGTGIDDVATVPVSFRSVPRIDWPEHPGDEGMIMVNDKACYFATKPKRKAR